MEDVNIFSMKNIEDILGLTPVQAGMLFHYLEAPGSLNYIEQLSLHISGEIHLEIFKKAWNAVIETNEMLRVIFRWEKLDNPVQVILKPYELQPAYHDVSQHEAGQKRMRLEKIKTKEREHKFDLRDVAFRVTLCKIEDYKYEMIVSNHHILYDGWSNGVILKEFFKAYHGLCLGGRAIKRPVKPPFREFVKWIQSRDRSKQEQYWRDYLTGFGTPTELPIKRRIEEETANAEDHSIILNEDIKGKLDFFAGNNRVTPASVFYTAWGILLQKYCDSEDVVFGTTVSGRSARVKEIENMVGLFINTIPLRVRSAPGNKIIDTVSGIENVLQVREEFESTPLPDIGSYSTVDGGDSLFDTIVAMENYPLDSRILPEGSLLSVNSYSMAEMTHYDLTVSIMPFNEIEVKFSYNRGFIDKEIVENLAGHFKGIVQRIIENPEAEISRLEIISHEEKNRVLYEFNNTAAEYPAEKHIHRLFEEQAEQAPDHIAVLGPGRTRRSTDNNTPVTITYRELNEQSNRLARLLIEKGVLADNIVGIKVGRSVEMLIGIFGILKSGGAYLPIDPGYPKDRIDFMLKDSGAKILVTAGIMEERANFPASPLPRFPASDSSTLAYVIYTSGSTGKPKGVLIENRSVINFIKGITDIIPFRESDRILSLTTISFDIFGLETILPLTKGAAVIIGSAEEQLDARLGALVMVREAVTIFQATPSRLQLFIQDPESGGSLKRLNYLLVGGEVFPPVLLEKLGQLTGGSIYNVYGPTETTVWSTIKEVSGHNELNIGRPLVNTFIYMLNRGGFPRPVGAPGEICISGEGAAVGYINRPELTREKFSDNPFVKGERLYTTGDIGRWLPDGNIECLGRIDQQVKIRGFRIEPGEIENRLLKHEQVKDTVTVVTEDETGDKRLAAYFVSDIDLSDTELRDYLLKDLPDYMIPSYFVRLEKIPLTPSGKTDRKALPEPEFKKAGIYVAPRDVIETKMVEIWAGILGENISPDRVGIDDNFFRLGGHSIKAVMLSTRIHKELNVNVPLTEIFKSNTVRSLSEYIKEAGRNSRDICAPMETAEKREYYPLANSQKGIFVQHHKEAGALVYNISQLVTLDYNIDLPALTGAFKKLIERHESLRTSFGMVDGQPVQFVQNRVDFEIEYHEIDNSPPAIDKILSGFIKPFDLSRAPLFHVGLIKEKTKRRFLMLDIHHIITDGISMNLVLKEMTALYNGNELPPITRHYKDFCIWQNSSQSKEKRKKQGEFWQREFRGNIPRLKMPFDFKRPEKRRFEGGHIKFVIDEELYAKLNEISRETETTRHMVLLAIYNILLAKYSWQEDVIVGSPVSGRNHAGLESIIGVFVNMTALRNRPQKDKTFRRFLLEVKDKVLAALDNQDYHFEELVAALDLHGDVSRNPLFDVVLVMQDIDSTIKNNTLGIAPYELELTRTPFDLILGATGNEKRIDMTLAYPTALYKPSTIERMAEHYLAILKQAADNVDITLNDIRVSHILIESDNTIAENDLDEFEF